MPTQYSPCVPKAGTNKWNATCTQTSLLLPLAQIPQTLRRHGVPYTHQIPHSCLPNPKQVSKTACVQTGPHSSPHDLVFTARGVPHSPDTEQQHHPSIHSHSVASHLHEELASLPGVPYEHGAATGAHMSVARPALVATNKALRESAMPCALSVQRTNFPPETRPA